MMNSAVLTGRRVGWPPGRGPLVPSEGSPGAVSLVQEEVSVDGQMGGLPAVPGLRLESGDG